MNLQQLTKKQEQTIESLSTLYLEVKEVNDKFIGYIDTEGIVQNKCEDKFVNDTIFYKLETNITTTDSLIKDILEQIVRLKNSIIEESQIQAKTIRADDYLQVRAPIPTKYN